MAQLERLLEFLNLLVQQFLIEKINYLVPYNNKVIHFAINCHMSCKKIEENFVSLISSIK